MNKFIRALKELDVDAVQEMVAADPDWLTWSETDGKNALHYLCGVRASDATGGPVVTEDPAKEAASLQLLKFLLKKGMDINSIHNIPEKKCDFPATPLWYAYTRGRNQTLYKYLLKQGARPDNCMFAIAWYNDPAAASLFRKHGARITDNDGKDGPFMAAIYWKRFAVAEWFLKNGADPDVTDPKGRTPLIFTVMKKYPLEYIRLLMKYGADPDKTDGIGKSARQTASSYRDKSFLTALKKGSG